MRRSFKENFTDGSIAAKDRGNQPEKNLTAKRSLLYVLFKLGKGGGPFHDIRL